MIPYLQLNMLNILFLFASWLLFNIKRQLTEQETILWKGFIWNLLIFDTTLFFINNLNCEITSKRFWLIIFVKSNWYLWGGYCILIHFSSSISQNCHIPFQIAPKIMYKTWLIFCLNCLILFIKKECGAYDKNTFSF